MPDKGKVVNGLRHCLYYGSCLDCPYDGLNCQNDVLDDALALLKEQPEIVRCKDCENNICGRCRNLDLWVETDPEWFCADGKRKEQPDV